MKKIYWIGLVALIVITAFVLVSSSSGTSAGINSSTGAIEEKVYIALEGEGKVAVVDSANAKVIRTIDLSLIENGETVRYMAHNVQVAPDGKNVLVTANAEEGMEMENDAMPNGAQMPHGQNFDMLIVIDPSNDQVVRRIPIEIDSHLAHVVLGSDNKTAFITLQEKGRVYSVDIESGKIISKVELGEKSGPHGLRMASDGSSAFIATIDDKSIVVMDTKTNVTRKLELPGAAVQTAVTLDGAYVFASLYDTKQVAWFDLKSGEKGLIALPEASRGPVQIYPSPDSRYLYVADQGYYFEQPTGSIVYRIDIDRKAIDQTITAGAAPHGVVVNAAGTRVFVTNLLSDDMSIIDTATNKEVARILVGDMPNGVSVWNAKSGGTR